MPLVMRLDEFGRPAWIAAVLLGFWMFWPVGVVLLAYLAWTGRLRDLRQDGPRGWSSTASPLDALRRWVRGGPASSGNAAFDDYRADTLRRLEDEQREFAAYLERLRQARDKAEFDQFMADQRRRGAGSEPAEAG